MIAEEEEEEEEGEAGEGGGEAFILWQPIVSAVAHALSSISAGENDRITCFQCAMAKGEVFPIGSQNAACCLILVPELFTFLWPPSALSTAHYSIFCCLVDEAGFALPLSGFS